jgi:hypothetical protein
MRLAEIEQQVTEAPSEGFKLLMELCLSIVNEPLLEPYHPDAKIQQVEKRDAVAALDKVEKAGLWGRALERASELLGRPLALPGDLRREELLQAKQDIRIALLQWDTHYGAGGPLEGLKPTSGKNRDQA